MNILVIGARSVAHVKLVLVIWNTPHRWMRSEQPNGQDAAKRRCRRYAIGQLPARGPPPVVVFYRRSNVPSKWLRITFR